MGSRLRGTWRKGLGKRVCTYPSALKRFLLNEYNCLNELPDTDWEAVG